MIVSQPAKVISEVLSANQRVEQIGDHEERDDEAEHVGPAHVADERPGGQPEAHIRSIPSIIASSSANMTSPRTMATASMRTLLTAVRHGGMTIRARGITISLRARPGGAQSEKR